MQTLKIFIGIILGIAAINVMITTLSTDSGAGLAGASTGFLLIGGLSGWLIYSGIKGNSKK